MRQQLARPKRRSSRLINQPRPVARP